MKTTGARNASAAAIRRLCSATEMRKRCRRTARGPWGCGGGAGGALMARFRVYGFGGVGGILDAPPGRRRGGLGGKTCFPPRERAEGERRSSNGPGVVHPAPRVPHDHERD